MLVFTAFWLLFQNSASSDWSNQTDFPLTYRNTDPTKSSYALYLDAYPDLDFFIIGNQELYDASFVNSNGSVTSVSFAMRARSDTGEVKWVKAVDIKEIYTDYEYFATKVTNDQVAWINLIEHRISFIFRIDENGNILQVISFGSMNLHFAISFAGLYVISESEFLYQQALIYSDGIFSSGYVSNSDFSIARINTNFEVKYNIMLNYGNVLQYSFNFVVDNRDYCYVIIWTFSEGYLFSMFDINNVNKNQMINLTYLFPAYDTFSQTLFGWRLFHTPQNTIEDYDAIVSVIWQSDLTQFKIVYYNSSISLYISTSVINTSKELSFDSFYNYNATLIYGRWLKDGIYK